jgi:hypothetical protein
MRIFVHYPKNPEDIRQLELTMAKVHAESILWNIQNLICPQSQKNKLLDCILQELALNTVDSFDEK